MHNSRESWLLAAVEALRPMFAAHGKPLPEKLRVSCGWPSRGGTSTTRRVMGQTWENEDSADNSVEIFVSPTHAEAVQTLDTLVHECVHAALISAGQARPAHGKSFQNLCTALGLEEPWKSATAGPTLKAVLVDLAAKLGDYPFAPLRPKPKEVKQTTRMLKCNCPTCGYTLRTTAKWLAVAVPECPVDKITMNAEAPDGEVTEGQGQEGGTPVAGLAEGEPSL